MYLPTAPRTSRTSHGRSRPATRAAGRATPSCASTGSGTSRTSAISSRPSSTRPGRSSARPRTRSSPQPAMPGSRPAARRRWSRSVRRRRTARTSARRARPTRSRLARSRGSSPQANKRLKFDAWAQHPYPVPVNQGPGQKVRYPNVALQHAQPLRARPRQVVRPQEHPDLDHRVRQRDEAGRAEGRHRGPAGGLRAAGDRLREEGQADPDVHLVRLPRLERQPLAERGLPRQRRGQAGGLPLGERREGGSTGSTASSSSRGARRIRPWS